MANPNQPQPGNAGPQTGSPQTSQPNATQAAAGHTHPAAKPPQAQPKAAGGGKKIDLRINGNSVVKLQLANDGANLQELWNKFRAEHSFVSNKNALPTSFAGELVNQHGAVQLDKNEQGAEAVELRM